MKKQFAPILIASALVGFLPACGGSSNTAPHVSSTGAPTATPAPGATPTPIPPTSGPTSTQFVISLNGGGESILTTRRRPEFVSPSTQSITFAVDGGSANTQNLSASATNCASANSGVRCTVPLANVAAGAHTLALTAWSGTNGTGNKLGANSSIAFTTVGHEANTVSGVIGGIATGITFVPLSNAFGTMTQGFTVYESGTQPATFAANPIDASGNVIVGPGSPSITVATSYIANVITAGVTQNTFTVLIGAADYYPLLESQGELTAQLTPVANSGGAPISAAAGLFGIEPRIYVVGTNGSVSSYDGLGNLQSYPGATAQINTAVGHTEAIAWDPTSNELVAARSDAVNNYDSLGDNLLNTLSQGAVIPSANVLAWDDNDQVAFEYDSVSKKLAQIGTGPNPTAITLLGSATTSPYVALAWSGGAPGNYPDSDYLYGATGSGEVLLVGSQGANAGVPGSTYTSPGVGAISGLAYDPATEKLFVAGSKGVTYYIGDNLAASPGFTGVTGATGIAFNPANGLVYVAEGTSQIQAFNESGVLQFTFSTGTVIPNQIIYVP